MLRGNDFSQFFSRWDWRENTFQDKDTFIYTVVFLTGIAVLGITFFQEVFFQNESDLVRGSFWIHLVLQHCCFDKDQIGSDQIKTCDFRFKNVSSGQNMYKMVFSHTEHSF